MTWDKTLGNVGIGTTSPSQKLDVVGIANSTGAVVGTSNMTFQNGQTGNTTTFEVWKDNNGKAVVTRYWNGTALVLNVSG